MNNAIITKLINKINFDLSSNLDLDTVKELSFVPVNVQNNVFFVAISTKSNKDEISKYLANKIENKLEFIYLTKDNFDLLFISYLKEASKRLGIVFEENGPTKADGDQIDLSSDDDYSLDIDSDEEIELVDDDSDKDDSDIDGLNSVSNT